MDSVTARTTPTVKHKQRITAREVSALLDHWPPDTTVLSLDCFDTVLWRYTATPKDVFYALQERPLFQSLGVTAYQRIAAAARAYREKFISYQSRQVNLQDIYAPFAALSDADKAALMEEEICTEIEMCYPFWPFVELIQRAAQRGIRVVIVSDMYLSAAQLRRLLAQHLPTDAMNAIEHIFTSYDYGVSKSEGLFQFVMQHLEVPAETILHLGDHPIADFEAPQKMGLKAMHFQQFDDVSQAVLRWQTAAASLATLAKPTPTSVRETRYQPFRPIFSLQNPMAATPEHVIGYMTFGPILYAFARFMTDEIQSLRQQGKKVKVFFLLRDAYLLHQACEAYAGKPMGELARIRKFVAVAASFRTQADIDYYISGIQPEYYNTWVICEQLLLPPEQILKIQQRIQQSPQPQETFYAILHSPEVMEFIFQQSAEARKRLMRYLQNVLQVEAGDTVVLVDTGYHGVTQDFLRRALQDEMQIDIQGRYFMGSHEPDRPECKSLLTSTWCEHGLFEQSCTYKEGAVSGYDEDGQPLFEALKLSDAQYEKVQFLQHEAIRFIRDAREYFAKCTTDLPFSVLKQNAEAALLRHIFFPLPMEVTYFANFQHDKDMGPNRTKTLYDVDQQRQVLPQLHTLHKQHPYEDRAIHVEKSLSSLMKRAFDLDFAPEEKSFCYESVKIVMVKDNQFEDVVVQAIQTHDGYYSFYVNTFANCHLGIVWGATYAWVQVEALRLMSQPSHHFLSDPSKLVLHKMNRHQNLFECLAPDAYLMLPAINPMQLSVTYQVVFRPLIRASHLLKA